MKKINIKGGTEKYITTLKAKEILKVKKLPDDLQKYSMRGSRKTYYLLEDVKALASPIKEIEVHAQAEGQSADRQKNIQAQPDLEDKFVLEAYVDGSYNQKTGVYGSAVIMVNNREVIAVKTSNGRKMNSMRNVAGEISAAALAVKMAEEFLADSLIIKYDYEGIEKWVTGEWSAKNEYTSQYAQFMMRKRQFSVRYEHVKAHTGDKYNELADDMAVRAAGLKPSHEDMKNAPVEKKIPEDTLRMKYQVKTSCIEGIKEFYSKEKHVFKDYISLKAGTGDNFSRYWSMDDFNGLVSEDAAGYIKERLSDNNEILGAMRWTARGLDPYDAVKKVSADAEIYKNKRK